MKLSLEISRLEYNELILAEHDGMEMSLEEISRPERDELSLTDSGETKPSLEDKFVEINTLDNDELS